MEHQKEWMVHIWGGAWNEDSDPSIEKDYGIQEGYHYFSTEEEKNKFCEILNNPIYTEQGLMKDIKYGVMTHKRTVFVGTLKYEDKEFVIHYDFGYEYPEESAVHMFTEGDNSCDCNKSLIIQREYGNAAIEYISCGDKIILEEYHIEYWD